MRGIGPMDLPQIRESTYKWTSVTATYGTRSRTWGDRMILFDKLRQNAEAIRHTGIDAIAEARRLGVSSHYIDPTVGAGIVRELPDGTRQRLEHRNGEAVVVGFVRPRG